MWFPLQTLQWLFLSLYHQIKTIDGLITFIICPIYTTSKIMSLTVSPTTPVLPYSCSSLLLLLIGSFRKPSKTGASLYLRAFALPVLAIWNALSPNMYKALSHISFKSLFKEHFLIFWSSDLKLQAYLPHSPPSILTFVFIFPTTPFFSYSLY